MPSLVTIRLYRRVSELGSRGRDRSGAAEKTKSVKLDSAPNNTSVCRIHRDAAESARSSDIRRIWCDFVSFSCLAT
jgi:hypothetical protein